MTNSELKKLEDEMKKHKTDYENKIKKLKEKIETEKKKTMMRLANNTIDFLNGEISEEDLKMFAIDKGLINQIKEESDK